MHRHADGLRHLLHACLLPVNLLLYDIVDVSLSPFFCVCLLDVVVPCMPCSEFKSKCDPPKHSGFYVSSRGGRRL